MKIKVMYNSRSGNTKKVAEVIAKTVGTSAVRIADNNNFDSADILFIGDGIYGFRPDKSTEMFIKTLNSDKVKNAVVFGTYGGQTRAIYKMKELLKKQGINVYEESFGCKGKFFIMHHKHPDVNDLKAAELFAKEVLGRK